MKKQFKDTKFNKFLGKVAEKGKDIAPIVAKAVTGNISGALADTLNMVSGDAQLSNEFRLYQMDFQREMYELEIKDRENARLREVEMAKTGKTDWLMYATGLTALLSFAVIVYAVIWVDDVTENKLFIHLMGMVEGTALSIFAYYFGSSKGSKDKTELLNKK